jgi:hypothetical protein
LDTTFLAQIFPKGLLDHFTITGFLELGDIRHKAMFYEIYLEENNEILGGYDQNLYETKDFQEVELQDFPIRGKAVYLKIRRRRWRLKSNKSVTIKNDFSHIAASSGFTNELSAFLKDDY